jgi:hypothetical protein
MSFGGTETHDHHILIIANKAGVEVRYSRCPLNLSSREIFEYYNDQVNTDLQGYLLVQVIEDLAHVHPKVINWTGEYFPNGSDAHMP